MATLYLNVSVNIDMPSPQWAAVQMEEEEVFFNIKPLVISYVTCELFPCGSILTLSGSGHYKPA
jgi:hypothetical protein